MHFFYLDESGDTGTNLDDQAQPIMVLGGISLRDEGWNKTYTEYMKLIESFFSGNIPDGFELHANELLSPNGDGLFSGRSMNDRSQLARDVIDLIEDRKHGFHYIAFDKAAMQNATCCIAMKYDTSNPYLLGFDYMMTFINWHVKEKLGNTARGLVITDEMQQYHNSIDAISRERRFDGPAAHRVKWITEINYPVDSRKNSMIQISDLAIFCTRRLLEIEQGHRPGWTQGAKDFYASRFSTLYGRVSKKGTVDRQGRNMNHLNDYINAIRFDPVGQWKRRYTIT
jgi:hypothetical protein